jgi:hypothetical protein
MVTLARRMGTTEHLSPLLQKLRRMGLGSASALMQIAVQRGCRYYAGAVDGAMEDPGRTFLPDEELAVALLHGSTPWSPESIRMGAAMLGAPGNDARRLARLARLERCERALRHVAEAGLHFEPTNPFWSELLRLLPHQPAVADGIMPHPTRYVAMTGLTRDGRTLRTQWIRPSVCHG